MCEVFAFLEHRKLTVETTDSIVEYTGNGVTTAFPVPFEFPANEDLVVTQVYNDVSTVLVLGTDYLVVGAGAQAGGAVITTVAPPLNSVINISRVLEALQKTDLRNQGRYFAETHESVFDYLTMLIQQGFSGLSRALRRPLGKDYFDAEGRRIANVANPSENQDAVNKQWTEQYVGSVVGGIQGPINNAANILYLYPDGTPHVVQDLSSISSGSKGIGHDGRDLDDTINWNAVAYLTPASDFSAQLQDFANNKLSGAVKTGTLKPGVRRCLSQVTFPADVQLNMHGVVLDFSDASAIGNFPDFSCIKFGGGSLLELSPLSVAPSVGSYSITFASTQPVASDDIIIIWDSAPGSWSGFRPEYMAGEPVIVRSVSGGVVSLAQPLLSSYSTSVRVFKLMPTSPKVNGLKVICPSGISVTGILATLARRPVFRDVYCALTSVAGLTIDRSFGFHVIGGGSSSDRNVITGDNYGLSISNSDWGLVEGGNYSSRRHAISMGGTSLDGAIPTRHVKVKGATLSSWDVQCADMHGNVEFSEFEGCTMMNGVTISGNNNRVRGCDIYAPANSATGNGVAVSINEAKGVNFELSNLNIFANGTPSTTSRGVIDFGGNSLAMNANTTLGGTLLLSDIRMSAPNATIPWKIVNNGSLSADKQLVVKDVHWHNPPATRASNGILQNASGTQFTRADVSSKFKDVGAPASYTLDASKVSGLSESGAVTITTTAVSAQDVTVTFNNRFPKNPAVNVTANAHQAGVVVACCVTSIGVGTATLRLYSTGGTAMTAGISVTLNWTAKIDE